MAVVTTSGDDQEIAAVTSAATLLSAAGLHFISAYAPATTHHRRWFAAS